MGIWGRLLGGKASQTNAQTLIEADGLLTHMSIGLAGWEEVNLSACLIDYALKHGLPQSVDCDAIRERAAQKYSTAAGRRRVVLKALDTLLVAYNKPNTYAPNKAVVEKARNAIAGGKI